MKPRSSGVVLTGVGLVAILSLFAALDYWHAVTSYNEEFPDPYRIGYQQPRFREAAKAIPVDAVVGYISNLEFGDIQGSAAFFGTQYALTPRIVMPFDSPQVQDLVVGNYSTKVDAADVARQNHMSVVKDFGAGVILFRKEKPE